MPLDFSIPNLAELRPRSTFFAVNRLFRGAGPQNPEAYALVVNFVRLADLAINEFELGREAILQFKASNENLALGRAIRASSHFETCISTLKRAIDHLKAIRGHRKVPPSLKYLLPRGINVLSGDVESQVANMRHAIQHLEGRIKKGEILAGQPIILAINENDIELGAYRIRYSDLADWLKELHNLASKVSNYWE